MTEKSKSAPNTPVAARKSPERQWYSAEEALVISRRALTRLSREVTSGLENKLTDALQLSGNVPNSSFAVFSAALKSPTFEQVRAVQMILKRQYPTAQVDGILGPQTLSRMTQFIDLKMKESGDAIKLPASTEPLDAVKTPGLNDEKSPLVRGGSIASSSRSQDAWDNHQANQARAIAIPKGADSE
jgi:hypothetical protein